MRKYDGSELKKGSIYSNDLGFYEYVGHYHSGYYSFKQVDITDDGNCLILDNDVRLTAKELWFD